MNCLFLFVLIYAFSILYEYLFMALGLEKNECEIWISKTQKPLQELLALWSNINSNRLRSCAMFMSSLHLIAQDLTLINLMVQLPWQKIQ